LSDALREKELGKIKCGREHFRALENNVEYDLANSFDSFLDIAEQ
jgi:type III restriction enzyme